MAICAYPVLARVKHQLRSEYSIYEMAQILETSAFSKKPINQLFTKKQINQNFKEQPNYSLTTIYERISTNFGLQIIRGKELNISWRKYHKLSGPFLNSLSGLSLRKPSIKPSSLNPDSNFSAEVPNSKSERTPSKDIINS